MTERMSLYMNTEKLHRTVISFDESYLELFFPYNISDIEVARYIYKMTLDAEPKTELFEMANKRLHLFMDGEYTRKDYIGNPNLYLVEVLQWIYKKAQGDQFSPKVTTIKFCRSLTGCGLKEAKDFCEDEVF